jgi:hypothetical protein
MNEGELINGWFAPSPKDKGASTTWQPKAARTFITQF